MTNQEEHLARVIVECDDAIERLEAAMALLRMEMEEYKGQLRQRARVRDALGKPVPLT